MSDDVRRYTWGKKDPKPIVEMATEHILNALSTIDERRAEIMHELAELNVKAKIMKNEIVRRERKDK